MAWSKDKFNYNAQKIRELNVDYGEIARIKEKMYKSLTIEDKIDILLAKRSVYVFRTETIEDMLSYKIIGGKVEKPKMGSNARLIIEDYIYHLKNKIILFDDAIYKILKLLSRNDSRKDKIIAKLEKEHIYSQPYGCEYFDTNFIDQIADKQDPFEFIMLSVILRNLHSIEFITIQKHLTNLHKTPRTSDNEKAYFVYYLHELRKEYIEKNKQAHKLYFRCFPKDDPRRSLVRKKILNCSRLFQPFICSMLYDPMVDTPDIWWNFQELTTPDRELQFIVKKLVNHIDTIRNEHGPTLCLKKRSISSEILWLSYTSILVDTDITEFIRTSPHLPHANNIINNIPPDVFEERKELFEEIIKLKCWEYMKAGFRFPTTAWTNATSLYYGDSM